MDNQLEESQIDIHQTEEKPTVPALRFKDHTPTTPMRKGEKRPETFQPNRFHTRGRIFFNRPSPTPKKLTMIIPDAVT